MGNQFLENTFIGSAGNGTGVILPQNASAGTYTCRLDRQANMGSNKVVFILAVGALGSSGTVDASVQESSASGSGYAALTTPVAITQVVTTGSKLCLIEVKASSFTKRYCQLLVTVGTAACYVAAVGLLSNCDNLPVTQTADQFIEA